jgi:hypothetical protein
MSTKNRIAFRDIHSAPECIPLFRNMAYCVKQEHFMPMGQQIRNCHRKRKRISDVEPTHLGDPFIQLFCNHVYSRYAKVEIPALVTHAKSRAKMRRAFRAIRYAASVLANCYFK